MKVRVGFKVGVGVKVRVGVGGLGFGLGHRVGFGVEFGPAHHVTPVLFFTRKCFSIIGIDQSWHIF